jgi:hypothetical protein
LTSTPFGSRRYTRLISGELGLYRILEVCTDHLSQPQQEDGAIGEFLSYVGMPLALGIECLCELTIQQAEFQRNISCVEALREFVLPGELLR